MDALVRERLTAAGVLDGDGFARRVVQRVCPRCRRDTIQGLDARSCGLPITCEATPLDTLGEVVALSHGARSYDLVAIHRPGGYSLEPRLAVHITRPREHLVVATHRCDLRWPEGELPRPVCEELPDYPPF